MAERKDHYKNNFPEAEGRANDEEQECRAEADAFERLRNEYNKTVKELEDLEKSKSGISRGEQGKLTRSQWPQVTETSKWKGSVVHDVCIASGDDNTFFVPYAPWNRIHLAANRLCEYGGTTVGRWPHSAVEDNALFSLRCHVVRGREVTRVFQNVG